MNLQKYTDNFLAKTLLPFIPHSISPNQVTWVRIFAIPFIFYFLMKENYLISLILFSAAALTDALDGAMARTRNCVTESGKILDPVADRGLTALVAFVFIPKYFGWNLLIYLMVLEIFNTLMAYRSRRKIKMNPEASWAGKVKMIIQCAAFIMIFIAIFAPASFWLGSAQILLYVSLVFTFLQAFLYPQSRAQAGYV